MKTIFPCHSIWHITQATAHRLVCGALAGTALTFSATMQAQVKTTMTLTVDGTQRNMIVYTPKNLPKNRPLVLSLHGMNQDAAYQDGMCSWEQVADTAKFVVVYPNGIDKSWDTSGTKDYDFMRAIIDRMYSLYAIDKRRVYINGFSMGSMFVYEAAVRMANVFAAFAPVSGYPLYDANNFGSSRPVPIIAIQGLADNVFTPSDIPPYVAKWAKRDNCNTTAKVTNPYYPPYAQRGYYATSAKYEWNGGTDGTRVVLVTMTNKGHWYSDDAKCLLSSVEIWNFVKNYTLPDASRIDSTGCQSFLYDFSTDEADTTASTPPSQDMTMGTGNTATAGIVSYTDINKRTYKCFRPYSGGQRNSTGAVDLLRFPHNATDYSVTWRSCLGTYTSDYKIGMLLRADSTKVGNATSGYVQGMRQGYLCLACTNRASKLTQMRIYKSTSALNTLTTVSDVSISTLNPLAGRPVWYRATVKGYPTVTVNFQYSLDSIHWNAGPSYVDFDGSFRCGGTQIVWGLGTTAEDFFLSQISFLGQTASALLHTAVSAPLPDTGIAPTSTAYYNLAGQRISRPGRGICVVSETFADGHRKTFKMKR